MVKIAGRAEWDFSLNMFGAMRSGRMDFSVTETVIDLVDGGANIFGSIELVLIKSHLRIGAFL